MLRKLLFIFLASGYLTGFAQDDAEQAKQQKQKQARILYNDAATKINEKRYQEALVKLNQAALMAQDFDLAFLQRGKVKFELKDYNGAMTDFQKVITMNPAMGEAYWAMGYTLLVKDTSSLTKATDNFTQAISNGYEEA